MRFLSAFIPVFCFGLVFCHAGFAQDAVQQKIEELAVQQVQSLCEKCEVAVEVKWMPGEIGRIDSSQIDQIRFEGVGLPRGYQPINLSYLTQGQSQTRQLQLLVEIHQKLPVANKRIERHETIEAGDLVWKTKDLTRLQKLPLVSKEEVAGKSVTGLIRKGDMIHQSDLQQTPIINAGDDIQMVYTEGGVEVALDCRARQAKAKGEQIRVYSEKTRKTYLAKVVTPKKVVWEKTL